jgi:hypothetical protein
MDSIFKLIHPHLKKYNAHHILEVLEEVLAEAEEDGRKLTTEEIIELVGDILENDPPIG